MRSARERRRRKAQAATEAQNYNAWQIIRRAERLLYTSGKTESTYFGKRHIAQTSNLRVIATGPNGNLPPPIPSYDRLTFCNDGAKLPYRLQGWVTTRRNPALMFDAAWNDGGLVEIETLKYPASLLKLCARPLT